MERMIRFFLGPLLILAMTSCLAKAAEVVEEIVQQNYPVDPTARFTLQNADGSVVIYGADIDEMKLQAIKRAYSRERLEKININVAVRHGDISVTTSYPPKPKWGFSDRSGTVDYVIILPWRCQLQRVELGTGEMFISGMCGKDVRVRLGSGRLFGRNCFTDLQAAVGTGGVDVGYEWWEKQPFHLETTIGNGKTYLFIPGDAQFRLSAQTANGHIFSDFKGDEDQTERGRAKIDLLVGGNPNADMKVQAGTGGITIKQSYK